jgi:hypothetical protein
MRLLDWSFTSGEDGSTFHDLAEDIGMNAAMLLTDERSNVRET